MHKTLDSIRQAADKKYGSTDIEVNDDVTCKLLNPLRLKKDRRVALEAAQESLEAADGGEDTLEVLREIIRIVAQTEAQAEALLDAVGDDAGVLMELFETYSSGEELGEASASAS